MADKETWCRTVGFLYKYPNNPYTECKEFIWFFSANQTYCLITKASTDLSDMALMFDFVIFNLEKARNQIIRDHLTLTFTFQQKLKHQFISIFFSSIWVPYNRLDVKQEAHHKLEELNEKCNSPCSTAHMRLKSGVTVREPMMSPGNPKIQLKSE